MEKKKTIQGKYVKIEIIEHDEQDIKDFQMDNEMTTIFIIPEIVFSLNHNKKDRVDAQEALRSKLKEYVLNLANEISKI